MQKINSILKTIVAVAIVLVMAQGCVPTGGQPPANTFNVNIHEFNSSLDNPDTTIVIGGDSIYFVLLYSTIYSNPTKFMQITTKTPGFEILDVKKYLRYLNNDVDSLSEPLDMNILDAGVLVDNNYTANAWLPFFYIENYTNPYYTSFSVFYYNDPNGIYPLQHEIEELTLNTNQYVVLRKHIGTQYQYYWIRVLRDSTGIKVLNGKYQMNSIVTGQ